MGTHILDPGPLDGHGVILVTTYSPHPTLGQDLIRRLSDGIASCKSPRGLSHEARVVIRELCGVARASGWTPEQLLIAVKEACYSSPEISTMRTTSEREAILSTIVTACISEFYNPRTD